LHGPLHLIRPVRFALGCTFNFTPSFRWASLSPPLLHFGQLSSCLKRSIRKTGTITHLRVVIACCRLVLDQYSPQTTKINIAVDRVSRHLSYRSWSVSLIPLTCPKPVHLKFLIRNFPINGKIVGCQRHHDLFEQ
jgi:hypothetical protein